MEEGRKVRSVRGDRRPCIRGRGSSCKGRNWSSGLSDCLDSGRRSRRTWRRRGTGRSGEGEGVFRFLSLFESAFLAL